MLTVSVHCLNRDRIHLGSVMWQWLSGRVCRGTRTVGLRLAGVHFTPVVSVVLRYSCHCRLLHHAAVLRWRCFACCVRFSLAVWSSASSGAHLYASCQELLHHALQCSPPVGRCVGTMYIAIHLSAAAICCGVPVVSVEYFICYLFAIPSKFIAYDSLLRLTLD